MQEEQKTRYKAKIDLKSKKKGKSTKIDSQFIFKACELELLNKFDDAFKFCVRYKFCTYIYL